MRYLNGSSIMGAGFSVQGWALNVRTNNEISYSCVEVKIKIGKLPSGIVSINVWAMTSVYICLIICSNLRFSYKDQVAPSGLKKNFI